VPYRLSSGGATISVPADRVTEMRLQMAAAGILSGNHVGFDIFDRNGFGATDFTQKVNYQRAIEGELARTLEGMDEVETARVHVTAPRDSVFIDKTEPAKASVVLRMRAGRELSRERTAAVVNLVASAVEGLEAQEISVMDARGRVFAAPDRDDAKTKNGASPLDSNLTIRHKLETETAARIVELLEPVIGEGRVRANVAAEIDFSQVEQTAEKFDPKSATIRSQQTLQESRTGGLARAPTIRN
jgi:flagellar M-ring protein FliF